RIGPFHRRPVNTAEELERDTTVKGRDGLNQGVDPFRLRHRGKPDIDRAFSVLRDDVGRRSARDGADIDRRAAFGSVQLVQLRDLPRKLKDRAGTLFWVKPCVSRQPACTQGVHPRALPPGLHTPRGRGLEDQTCLCDSGLAFHVLTSRSAADLLVTCEQYIYRPSRPGTALGKISQRLKGNNDICLHIKAAAAIEFVALD